MIWGMRRSSGRVYSRQRSLKKILLVAALLISASCSFGMMFSVGKTVPVDRLIKNLSRYVKEHPKDAQGFYALGRIHGMAFVNGPESLSVEPGLVEYPPRFHLGRIGFYKSERQQESDLENASRHLEEAVLNYTKATQLDSTQAMYFLGLGWILQRGGEEAPLFGAPPLMPPCHPTTTRSFDSLIGSLVFEGERADAFDLLISNLPCAIGSIVHYHKHNLQTEFQEKLVRRLIARAWEDEAIKAYRKAIELSFDKEYKNGGDASGDAICVEAADHIIEMLKWNRTANERRPEDIAEIQRLEEMEKTYRSVPRAISPIIFPIEGSLSCSELVDYTAKVSFDLDGSGESLLWPWVRPNAALLVWDPFREGQITSGRQLFGNVTWWMFWRDGYKALEALDDDDNGWLEGKELEAIAVWQDRNSNAVSDIGEVRPVSETILRIGVIPDDRQDGELTSRRGIVLRDGRVLPTFDWFPVGVPAGDPQNICAGNQ
jgi:hypothetical protein